MLGDIAPIECDQKILKNSNKKICDEICAHVGKIIMLVIFLFYYPFPLVSSGFGCEKSRGCFPGLLPFG